MNNKIGYFHFSIFFTRSFYFIYMPFFCLCECVKRHNANIGPCEQMAQQSKTHIIRAMIDTITLNVIAEIRRLSFVIIAFAVVVDVMRVLQCNTIVKQGDISPKNRYIY